MAQKVRGVVARSKGAPVMAIGIDEKSYAGVSDFSKFLLHPANREQLSFQLREDGFDEPLPTSGWQHRRLRVGYERAYREQLEQTERTREARFRRQTSHSVPESLRFDEPDRIAMASAEEPVEDTVPGEVSDEVPSAAPVAAADTAEASPRLPLDSESSPPLASPPVAGGVAPRNRPL